MALTKPILLSRAAFDASQATTFTFNVIGGNQVVKNRLVISDATTGASVYDQTQSTFKYEHTVAANTLTNGTQYQAQLQTFDAQNNASVLSNSISFYCYASPQIAFTNIPVSGIIENSSYAFAASYTQAQGELLNSYSFTLYNYSQSQIATSGVKYVGSSDAPPTALSYTFSGFDDNSNYYIKIEGYTVNNTYVSTALTPFSVKYTKPNIFTIMDLTNHCDAGYISIQSNIAPIDGTSNPTPPTYIDNKKVDLTAVGSWVKWASGYSINGDFNLGVWLESLILNKQVLIMTSANGTVISLIYVGTYFEMYVYEGSQSYYVKSNAFAAPSTGERIFVNMKRVGNYYQLTAQNQGVIV